MLSELTPLGVDQPLGPKDIESQSGVSDVDSTFSAQGNQRSHQYTSQKCNKESMCVCKITSIVLAIVLTGGTTASVAGAFIGSNQDMKLFSISMIVVTMSANCLNLFLYAILSSRVRSSQFTTEVM